MILEVLLGDVMVQQQEVMAVMVFQLETDMAQKVKGAMQPIAQRP